MAVILGRKPGGSGGGPGSGVTSIAKSGDSGLTGAVTLSEGSGVTLTQVGQDIEIASPAAGGLALISRSVLGSNQASVVFSAIPGTYEDLMLLWTARGTDSGNPNLTLRLNGDTGANYDRELLIAVGTTPTAANANGDTGVTIVGALPGSGAGAGRCASGKITIPGYARTVFHKSVNAEFSDLRGGSQSDSLGGLTAGLWRNTAAVTSVTLLPDAGSLLTGSVFSLYGLV